MKIGYSETFPIFGKDKWQKIWLEDEMLLNIQADATDEEIEEIMKKVRRIQYALKTQVETFFYESKAAAEKQMGTQVSVVERPSLTHIVEMIKEINLYQDAGELEKVYKYLAQSDLDLLAAYDNRMKQLLNTQNNPI